jgi:serine protease AprX
MQLQNEAKQKKSMSAAWGRMISVLVLCLLAAQAGFAADQGSGDTSGQQKLSKELRSLQGNNPVDVIVQFRVKPAAAHYGFLAANGGKFKNKKALHHVNSVALRLSPKALASLEAHPDVIYVSADRRVKRAADVAAPAVLADIAVQHYGLDGSGIGVALIDSGVSDHPDLRSSNNPDQSRVVYSESFIVGDSSTADGYGHGTHVAGIIGGNGSASASGYSRQYTGIAPGVSLINLRVLDANGGGSDSAVIMAIDRAIDLKDIYNIRVINLSLGRPVQESYTLDPICQAVEAAWNAGITVVVAAGNNGRSNYAVTEGYATINSPGNDPYVITVGATSEHGTDLRTDDAITSFSSKGPSFIDHIAKPDVVAPGNGIVSLLAQGSTLDANYPQFEVAPNPVQSCNSFNVCTSTTGQSQYFLLSGTSMATPVVSGAAALLFQQNPNLTPDQVKARLMKTAWKGLPQFGTAIDNAGNTYNEESDIFTVGAGYLDVQAALSNSDLAQGRALSPTAQYDPTTGTVTLVSTSSSVSGSSVVWGFTAGADQVWGTSVVWGREGVDANSVVWGTSLIFNASSGNSSDLTATSVVWGTVSANSVVWGSEASSVVWGSEAASVVWGSEATSVVWGSEATSVVWGDD